MTQGSAGSPAKDTRDAWSLAQVAQLTLAISMLAQSVRDGLEDFSPGELDAQGGVELPADRLHAVLDDVCALQDVAEQAGMLGGSLTPRDGELSVELGALAEAAEGALIEGGADIWMVGLAVRLMDRRQGYPALAEAIEVDPLGIVAGWRDTTVGYLLDSFRGGRAGRSSWWVCQAADVRAEDQWTSLDADALARVCAALREAAKYA